MNAQPLPIGDPSLDTWLRSHHLLLRAAGTGANRCGSKRSSQTHLGARGIGATAAHNSMGYSICQVAKEEVSVIIADGLVEVFVILG